MNSTLLFAAYKYRGIHPGPYGLSDHKLQSSWLLELLICCKLSFSAFTELYIIQRFVVTTNTNLVFDWVGSLGVNASSYHFF